MEFICTVCLINNKQKGHMTCPECKEDHEKSVLKILESGKTPETLFQYAERMTQNNLNKYRAQYEESRTSLDAFWDKACKEIKHDCRGVKLTKDNFIKAAKTRYEKLLKLAGKSEDLKSMESLKDTINILDGQLNWFAKIKQQKQIKAERKDAVA